MREVDILVAPSLDPDGIVSRSVRRTADDLVVCVVSLADLVAMKRRANRPQDRSDLEHLERLSKGVGRE